MGDWNNVLGLNNYVNIKNGKKLEVFVRFKKIYLRYEYFDLNEYLLKMKEKDL